MKSSIIVVVIASVITSPRIECSRRELANHHRVNAMDITRERVIRARALARGTFDRDLAQGTIRFAPGERATERATRAKCIALVKPPVDDDDVVVTLKGEVLSASEREIAIDQGSVALVCVKPRAFERRASARRGRERMREHARGRERDESESDEEDDLIEQLTGVRRRVELALVRGLNVERWVANVVARAPAARIVVWFALLRVAKKYELVPIYVLCTGFALIATNLGRKKPGELSAYSVFNPGARALPGTLTADDFDEAIAHRARAE